MLRLNEDCLMEIFQYLNINEQVMIVETDVKFTSALVSIWIKKYSNLNSSDSNIKSLSEKNFKTFFLYIVPYIKKFTICDIFLLPVKPPVALFYIQHTFPELIEINATNLNLSENELTTLIIKSPKLEILRVRSKEVTGKYIYLIRNLRILSIPFVRMDEERLCRILQKPTLTHFDNSRCKNIFPNAVQKLKRRNTFIFNKFEEFKFSDYDFMKLMQNKDLDILTSIKRMRIHITNHCKQVIWEPFLSLKGNKIEEIKFSYLQLPQVKRKFFMETSFIKNLKILEVTHWYETDAETSKFKMILSFIKNCLLLRHIYLKYFPMYFDYFFTQIEEMIFIVQNQKRAEKLQIHLNIEDTLFNRIQNIPNYKYQNALEFKIFKIDFYSFDGIYCDMKFMDEK